MMQTRIVAWGFALLLITGCAGLTLSVKRGEQLFNDPRLANGTTGKSCATCHANGAGISPGFDTKNTYMLMGLEIDSLAEVISSCNEITMRGEGLEPDSRELSDLVNYLRALKKEAKTE